MVGNSFGKNFRITTFGESHGKALGVVIDGVKSGLELSIKDIQKELDRRRPGQSKVSTARNEADKVEILSGVFKGKTTGAPICLVVYNKDVDSSKYENLKNLFRPGHADFTYWKKYGVRDYRGGGRSSGRETLSRVAAGAVAKKLLAEKKIQVVAYVKEIAGIKADFDISDIGIGSADLTKLLKKVEKNSVRCPDSNKAKLMEDAIVAAKKEGDSVGGIVECVVRGCPAGFGEPVFDKIDADIAKALMSIPAVKGVEFGVGFSCARMKGSENNDQLTKNGFKTNNSGGILGGISTGQDIVVRVAVKPTPSINKEQNTVDVDGKGKKIKIEGRHDPCICPRVVPVVEAMVRIAIVGYF